MIIEFMGLPGSGKSTLVKKLQQDLGATERILLPATQIAQLPKVQRILMKNYFALLGLSRRPLLLAKGVQFIRKSLQKGRRDLVGNIYNFYFVTGLYVRYSKKKDLVFFDQGQYQALWSVLFSADKTNWAPEDFPLYYKPDILVNLQVDPQELERRLQLRPGETSRLEEQLHRLRDGELQGYIDCIREAALYQGVRVLDIANSSEDTSLAKEMIRKAL